VPLEGKEALGTPGVLVYPKDWLVVVHRRKSRSLERSLQDHAETLVSKLPLNVRSYCLVVHASRAIIAVPKNLLGAVRARLLVLVARRASWQLWSGPSMPGQTGPRTQGISAWS
jgi:hypothetical protein